MPHGLKMASANLEDQTLHLTVRLQAGEEEEQEEEPEEEQDEEIGGLINSDGEVVEWDASKWIITAHLRQRHDLCKHFSLFSQNRFSFSFPSRLVSSNKKYKTFFVCIVNQIYVSISKTRLFKCMKTPTVIFWLLLYFVHLHCSIGGHSAQH